MVMEALDAAYITKFRIEQVRGRLAGSSPVQAGTRLTVL
jgi:hypothetical protein